MIAFSIITYTVLLCWPVNVWSRSSVPRHSISKTTFPDPSHSKNRKTMSVQLYCHTLNALESEHFHPTLPGMKKQRFHFIRAHLKKRNRSLRLYYKTKKFDQFCNMRKRLRQSHVELLSQFNYFSKLLACYILIHYFLQQQN